MDLTDANCGQERKAIDVIPSKADWMIVDSNAYPKCEYNLNVKNIQNVIILSWPDITCIHCSAVRCVKKSITSSEIVLEDYSH